MRKISFEDFPDFKPNLTPREIFKLGSFGGTYWRPIKSKFYKKKLKDQHKKYPENWWKDIPENNLSSEWKNYDINKNKYKIKVGTTLEFWEQKIGLKNLIHMDGFSGIVIFITDDALNMTNGRLKDGRVLREKKVVLGGF